MHHVGPVTINQTLCQQQRDTRQCGEPERIVTPIGSIRRPIWITLARVKMRRVDDE
jgi:hypothetical protein